MYQTKVTGLGRRGGEGAMATAVDLNVANTRTDLTGVRRIGKPASTGRPSKSFSSDRSQPGVSDASYDSTDKVSPLKKRGRDQGEDEETSGAVDERETVKEMVRQERDEEAKAKEKLQLTESGNCGVDVMYTLFQDLGL
eukprot:jgi/Mesvir1/5569/Mv15591-RA.1